MPPHQHACHGSIFQVTASLLLANSFNSVSMLITMDYNPTWQILADIRHCYLPNLAFVSYGRQKVPSPGLFVLRPFGPGFGNSDQLIKPLLTKVNRSGVRTSTSWANDVRQVKRLFTVWHSKFDKSVHCSARSKWCKKKSIPTTLIHSQALSFALNAS